MRKDEEQEYAELLKLAYQVDDALDTWMYREGNEFGKKVPVDERVTTEILRAKKQEAWNQVKFCKRRLEIELE